MYKHLKDASDTDVNAYLIKHRVVGGIDGLDLGSSSIFTNGTDDITFVCKYKLRIIRLLNTDFTFDMCQVAQTKAWAGESLVRDTDSSDDSSSDDSSAVDSSSDSESSSNDSGSASSDSGSSSSSDESSSASSDESSSSESDSDTGTSGEEDASDSSSTEDSDDSGDEIITVDEYLDKYVPSEFRDSVRNAFEDDIKVTELKEDVVVYGYYGNTSGERSYWYTPNQYENPQESLALPEGNTCEHLDVYVIPKGTLVLEGTVAPLFGKSGQGYQYYVYDSSIPIKKESIR